MTSNPMAQGRVYENIGVSDNPMTIAGTINKTLTLLLVVAVVATYTWNLVLTGFMDKAIILMWGGIGIGFIVALFTIFKPKYAMPLSILYAFCEGVALGTISALYETTFKGIVSQSVIATFLTLFSMLVLYRVGAIRATEKFRSVVVTATLGIMIFYLINIALSFFAPASLHFSPIYQSGIIGIGFSVVVIVVAALNFILDFNFIEKGANALMPKYFEWYGAFALLVTLVWLYLEILRLLSKLKDR